MYSDRVMVTTQHTATSSSVQFTWFESKPLETYMLVIEPGITLELDSHLPVRPYRLSITPTTVSSDVYSPYISPAVTRALRADLYPHGTLVFTALSPEVRYAIARLQADSDKTPPLLQAMCRAMLNQHALHG